MWKPSSITTTSPPSGLLASTLALALTLPLLVSLVEAAASLQHLTNITLPNNPTNVGFYLYVPDNLASPNPPILVNPHWCHGDAIAAFNGSTFAPELSEEYGFIVIYPDSPNEADKCWDVSSPGTLTHNGEGDSRGIVSMVEYVIQEYHGDKERVFVTGVSSGAMMTNVLIGAYPDVFAGGSAFAGVAMGCFHYGLDDNNNNNNDTVPSNASVDYWNDACATGEVDYTPAEWAAIVKRAYPGGRYQGWRPKMQVFHGTADTTLDYTNLGEEIKQWTGVFGLLDDDEAYNSLNVPQPSGIQLDTPLTNWTKMIYGRENEDNGDTWFEAYSAWNVTHNIPVQEDVVMGFFDLSCGSGCFRWGEGGPSK